MEPQRVKSKNLFNFRPSGQIDADILAREEEMKVAFGGDPYEAFAEMLKLPDTEFVKQMREMMNGMFSPIINHPVYLEGKDSCDHDTLTIATDHDGDYGVKVLVHTPKSMRGVVDKPAIVYCHGGGCVGGSADLYANPLSFIAMECGVVVFNVDYRLAPEARSPNNVLDYYQVVKYVSSHAKELGVDPARICISGESGGGYVCAGAMVKLAQEGESHLVKLAIPIIPMLCDYAWSDPAAMTKEEAESSKLMKKIWTIIAGGEEALETKKGDPLLFPGKASEAILAKMPPCIVWENEFDMYITEATRFAAKLRAAGRLLELVVIPGAKHGSGLYPGHAVFKLEREAYRIAIQEYLIR